MTNNKTFKVGDTVQLTGGGGNYTTYRGMAEMMGLQKWTNGCNAPLRVNLEVVDIKLHEDYNNELVYALQDFEGKQYLTGPDCMIKVKSKTQVFIKEMLISGEHIVECNNGERYLVAGNVLFGKTGHIPLTYYDEYLNYRACNEYSANKVFSCKTGAGYRLGYGVESLDSTHKLVWERNRKSQQQIEIEELQNVIQDAQERINKLANN